MKTMNKQSISIDEYERLFNDMLIDIHADEFRSIDDHIKSGVRYVIIPLHDGDYPHWHMQVIDLQEKKLHARNSLWGRKSKSADLCMVSIVIFSSLN